jgi:hypothetical protein
MPEPMVRDDPKEAAVQLDLPNTGRFYLIACDHRTDTPPGPAAPGYPRGLWRRLKGWPKSPIKPHRAIDAKIRNNEMNSSVNMAQNGHASSSAECPLSG